MPKSRVQVTLLLDPEQLEAVDKAMEESQWGISQDTGRWSTRQEFIREAINLLLKQQIRA